MQDPSHEEIEHTADWSFRVQGGTLAQLFANAARAMSQMEHGQGGEAVLTREVSVEGVDRETLLVNWLNELLYLEQTRQERYLKFDILDIGDTHLRARVHGQPAPGATRHIKAVTFHNLEVKKTSSGWQTTVVLDV